MAGMRGGKEELWEEMGKKKGDKRGGMREGKYYFFFFLPYPTFYITLCFF